MRMYDWDRQGSADTSIIEVVWSDKINQENLWQIQVFSLL
jgi:hypothetical protein